MSTLGEIEAAVDTLPTPQQMTLLRHLETKLRKASATAARLVLEGG
jgi:hypothetical protein